jgi:hypothetical protein
MSRPILETEKSIFTTQCKASIEPMESRRRNHEITKTHATRSGSSEQNKETTKTRNETNKEIK